MRRPLLQGRRPLLEQSVQGDSVLLGEVGIQARLGFEQRLDADRPSMLDLRRRQLLQLSRRPHLSRGRQASDVQRDTALRRLQVRRDGTCEQVPKPCRHRFTVSVLDRERHQVRLHDEPLGSRRNFPLGHYMPTLLLGYCALHTVPCFYKYNK
ncbi:MAG TPA: hypothetical protein VJ841_02900 [Candidatus Saccharimonadales bacterium]|nr:hypothetical protein [Candidatus Saccharimonadales bacterium]